jgi:beta-N-acetylhexosaminidase
MAFRMMMMLAFVCLWVPCFGEMTVEEKVGQLLMVHFNGEVANADARVLIQEVGVGAIIYYNWANGLRSPAQVLGLSKGLQELSAVPLLIAVDQEGGLVARLTEGFTVFPGNRALGETGDAGLAEEAAFAMGQELRAVGVNFNLAPVVDVNCNPRNPVIGIRSFGETAEVVTLFAERAVQGYQRSGVLTSLKHFPGHGDVEVDSHYDLPVMNKTKAQLEDLEFIPFKKLASRADTIMTAHILVPSIDPDHCATLSKKVLDILRNDIGYEGVIISDSLVMKGLLKSCTSIEDAAIRALEAGCDILMLGGKQLIGTDETLELSVADVKRIHQALAGAVKSGRISEYRLNEAVERVLALKNKSACTVEIKTFEHALLAKKIASLALKVVEQKALPASADVHVFCSNNAWKDKAQVDCVEKLLRTQIPVVVIVLRDPLDETLFPEAHLIIKTFSPTAPSLEAAFERLLE